CARLFERPLLHRGALVLRTLCLVGFTWQLLGRSLEGYRSYAAPPHSPFDGAWHVTAFATEPDGASAPGDAWTELVVGNSTRIGVTHASGAYERLQLELAESRLTLTRRGDPRWKAELTYELSAPERLVWSGKLDERTVRIEFERLPAREYLLET